MTTEPEVNGRTEVTTLAITVVHDHSVNGSRFAAILRDSPNASYEGYGETEEAAIANALELGGWAVTR